MDGASFDAPYIKKIQKLIKIRNATIAEWAIIASERTTKPSLFERSELDGFTLELSKLLANGSVSMVLRHFFHKKCRRTFNISLFLVRRNDAPYNLDKACFWSCETKQGLLTPWRASILNRKFLNNMT